LRKKTRKDGPPALGVEGVWGDWVLRQVERPCDCWRIVIRRKMRVKDIIAHLFDNHIMVRKDWTLERLVRWVETVEPTGVEPDFGKSLVIQQRGARLLEFQTLRQRAKARQQESEEWQAVRNAFEARHGSRQKKESA
jgi:hypothetical protein